MHEFAKFVAILIGYLAATAALFGGLAIGVLLLVQTNPTAPQERRTSPIPPRIAESIERKLMPLPAPEPEPIKPAIKQSPVALIQPPPKFTIRELNPVSPLRQKQKPPRKEASVSSRVPRPASAPAVSTGRTDFPY